MDDGHHQGIVRKQPPTVRKGAVFMACPELPQAS
nr:MAG TPA: hypothetical protein [Caudoviricetes sp.]